jgi:DNA-binding transcriptional LysR family regulator
MELKEIDLNLLVVFNELIIERRVSTVAEKLGVSQPAISNILNRLRKLLGDELFVRTSRGMDPTPYALQLSEPLAYSLQTIHATLNESTIFEPATSSRQFKIGLTDIGEMNFLPRLIERLDQVAPHVSITTLRTQKEDIADAMETGHLDMSIGALSGLQQKFFQRSLFKQSYVCMFRRGHILDKGSLSLEDFCAAEHLVVAPPGSAHAQINESIERRGIKRNVRVSLPHWTAVGHILGSGKSNLIATVPESYASRCAEPFGLTYVPHPIKLPEVAVSLFWHAKFHRESGNKWLRNLIFDLFADSKATALVEDGA